MATQKEKLNDACVGAAAHNSGNCSGTVRAVAHTMGYDLPVLSANGLIDYFNNAKNGWKTVNETDAQKSADDGGLVVAGKKAASNGHVVVVMPGGKIKSGNYSYKDKKTGKLQKAANHGFYPRACSTAMGGWPGGISTGDKSVFDSWGNIAEYKGVKYWQAPEKSDVSKVA